MPEWRLEDATVLVQQIGGTAFRAGYAPALFGSVLCRGFSENDIDLLLVRRPQLIVSDYGPVDKRLRDLNWQPAYFGTRNLCVEDRVPDRVIYRYKRGGYKLEVTVMDLPGQERPFFGAPGREEAIQNYLDELEEQWRG